jgi:hypothetical protein
MNSEDFFKDKEFNGKWKNKSGIYIIECPLFTNYVGYPVYKTGYARHSLYTRISNYRTAYGLVPFKIHLLYLVPEKLIGQRVNYANLTERVLQETARKYGEYSGVGEWYKNISLLLSIVYTIREDHLKRHKKSSNWEMYSFQKLYPSLKNIDLIPEEEIKGTFKDLVVGKHTRSGENEEDDEEYESIVFKGKKLRKPNTFIDEEGKEQNL